MRNQLALSPNGNVLTLTSEDHKKRSSVRTQFLNANPDTRLVGAGASASRTNFLVGSNSNAWKTDVPSFPSVRYESIYPGVDLIFYGKEGNLEYDFRVAPHADPSLIRFSVDGGKVTLDKHGDLIISTEAGDVHWTKPVVYQEAGQQRRTVDGRFVVDARGTVHFKLGAYNHDQALVIDPALSYLTYAGGSGNEAARGIALDGAGNAYITGFTTSTNLPSTGGTIQPTYGGGIPTHQSTGDVFVAKIAANGTLSWITYLGGANDDIGIGIAVDATGNSYITGYTNSPDFKTTPGAYQTVFGGQGRASSYHEGGDIFVAKLNPTGTNLLYSTFVGGSQDERGLAITIDAAGNAFVAGQSLSTNFPVSATAVQKIYGGGTSTDIYSGGDAVVLKLNPTGTALLYSTYLGGGGNDVAGTISVDGTGNAYVGGKTTSTNFPATTGAFQTRLAGISDDNAAPTFKLGDGFIAKLNPTGSALLYSTYLGGLRDDAVTDLAIDSTGAVYATGSTASLNFPVTTGVLQSAYAGPATAASYLMYGDGFVTKLNPAGSALVYSTYFGGSLDDIGWAIKVDSLGNAYVGGHSNSTDFKVSADAVQKTFGGRGGQSLAIGDGVFLKLNPTGTTAIYSSYLGGTADDAVVGLAIDGSGNAFLTGSTMSAALATASAPLKTFGGSNNIGLVAGDAFLARISDVVSIPGPVITVNGVSNAASYASGSVSPGEIVVVFGANMGPATPAMAGVTPTGLLDNVAATGRVYFDDVAAPIVYISAGQSAAIVPYGVIGKATTQVRAEFNGVKSAPLSVPVGTAVPGFFSADYSGTGHGAVFNENASVNTSANPESPGKIVVLFGTGEGQTDPPGSDGKVATSVYPKPALQATATVGGLPAEIVYLGAVPFQVAGLFQLNVRLPLGLGSGEKEVILKLGGTPTQSKLTVAVK
jgi:uncharacterized protein (TIGR03437 family)